MPSSPFTSLPAHSLTQHDALLRAVLDKPADDSSRLVYADWLEENGESERAEFIRVQCEVVRLGRFCLKGLRTMGTFRSGCCRVCDLYLRERALLKARGVE